MLLEFSACPLNKSNVLIVLYSKTETLCYLMTIAFNSV